MVTKIPVSVIIPTYNRANVIDKSINTVINQTYKYFQIYVVDDHSTDNTKEVVQKIPDKRITYLENKGRQGPSAARNKGILKSNGEFVAFLDCGDLWDEEHLERSTAFLSETDLDLVFSDLSILDTNNAVKVPSIFKRRRLYSNRQLTIINDLKDWKNKFIIDKPVIVTSTVVFKKNKLNIHFNEDFTLHEDSLFYLENILNNITIGFINAISCNKIEDITSLSTCYTVKDKIAFVSRRIEVYSYYYNKYKTAFDTNEKEFIKSFLRKLTILNQLLKLMPQSIYKLLCYAKERVS